MGQGPGRLQTILPWLLRSPNLACKMRQRHAARVQRPHGQIPEAIRPDSEDTLAHPDGHTAESPRTRSRNSGRQLCNHGAWYRYRTGALWLSETIAGRTLPVGSDEPTGPINIHVVESPGGASHCAPAPANIHVTKSPGTLLQRTARRIQRGECPQPCFHTGRNIHTHKSPRPLSMTMARRILRLILLTRLRNNDPSWLVPLPDRPRRQRSIQEV